ncbi:MAG: glycosyltransferase family 2 protein [Bacteroidales bacterium]|nr:glycosyltransferase family 2 protein [Bacteroidales bacterium]
MKLIIQIPCYNEGKTLAIALSHLPREVEGFDKVEWLIINDGSTDNTVGEAKKNGVDHVVSFKENQGLAKGFMAGLSACVRLGADVIVNTDADNQYNAEDIPKLTAPIVQGKADMVVGARPILDIEHFSKRKKMLQKLGSWTVKLASKTDIPDAPSGFRAFSREAAMKLNVFNEYTYTLETIIQAGRTGIAITSVPVRTNEDLRPSRLVKSIFNYVKLSLYTILRIFTIYKPFRTFFTIGAFFFLIGFGLGIRWLYLFFIAGTERTHVPSLILASICIILGVLVGVIAIIGDLLAVNRKLLEDIQYRVRKQEAELETLKHNNQ